MTNKSKSQTSRFRPHGDRFTADSAVTGSSFFPFARYTSVVGVHTTLLMFTALFLPRTAFLLCLVDPAPQLTSRDKPQHPFLDALTLNPLSTMLSISLGTVILQGWWGGWVRKWWHDLKLVGLSDEQRLRWNTLRGHKFRDMKDAWLFTLAASAMIHLILVLFGAPFVSHTIKTYSLAFFISVLIIFPPAYTLGVPKSGQGTDCYVTRMIWVRLFAEFSIRNSVERALVYPVLGTLLGCWVGAIPIALDWDRPWQAWPLTPALGGLLAYITSSILALTVSGTINLADEHVRSTKLKSR